MRRRQERRGALIVSEAGNPTVLTASHSPGALLAAERSQRKLSVADMAARTRLAPAQIEALEADAYDRLPGWTWVRGAIRSYARALPIDPAPVLGLHERLVAQTAEPSIVVPSQHIPFQIGAAGRTPQAMRIVIGVLAAIVAIGIAWIVLVPSKSAQTAATKSPPAAAAEAPAAGQAAAVSPAPGAAAATAPLPPAPPEEPAAASYLRFRFARETRLRVQDASGKVVFDGAVAAGSERELSGPAPLQVTIADVTGVTLTFNGKQVALAAADDNSARLTLR